VDPAYVLRLLFSEESQIHKSLATTEAREKISKCLVALEFERKLMYVWLDLKTIKGHLII
jgi:hypothetical protein